jgi:hypothetical protein
VRPCRVLHRSPMSSSPSLRALVEQLQQENANLKRKLEKRARAFSEQQEELRERDQMIESLENSVTVVRRELRMWGEKKFIERAGGSSGQPGASPGPPRAKMSKANRAKLHALQEPRAAPPPPLPDDDHRLLEEDVLDVVQAEDEESSSDGMQSEPEKEAELSRPQKSVSPALRSRPSSTRTTSAAAAAAAPAPTRSSARTSAAAVSQRTSPRLAAAAAVAPPPAPAAAGQPSKRKAGNDAEPLSRTKAARASAKPVSYNESGRAGDPRGHAPPSAISPAALRVAVVGASASRAASSACATPQQQAAQSARTPRAAPSRGSAQGSSVRANRVKWNVEEMNELVRLYAIHGPKWALILSLGKGVFLSRRTPVDLKDKVRNLTAP